VTLSELNDRRGVLKVVAGLTSWVAKRFSRNMGLANHARSSRYTRGRHDPKAIAGAAHGFQSPHRTLFSMGQVDGSQRHRPAAVHVPRKGAEEASMTRPW
jgi:hypothetical protein